MQAIAWCQLKNRNRLLTGDLRAALGLSEVQERKLLSRMAQSGLITRLKRGIYLVPSKVPPGGRWQPQEYEIAAQLMQEAGAQYQLGGPTAFNFYGLDEQVPNRVYIYNDKISGERVIGGISFICMKVDSERLGGTQQLKLSGGTTVPIATLSRTLLDAVYGWKRFNTLPRAYQWIKARKKDRELMSNLVKAALKYGNIGTWRRLGYCLESVKVEVALTRRLQRALPASASLIPWIPSRPSRGEINRDWGLIVNG